PCAWRRRPRLAASRWPASIHESTAACGGCDRFLPPKSRFMSLRRALDEALDPGPEFPSPALAHRISAALDDPPERRPRRTRQITAGLAVLVLAGLVVGTLLISRTAPLHPSNPLA